MDRGKEGGKGDEGGSCMCVCMKGRNGWMD